MGLLEVFLLKMILTLRKKTRLIREMLHMLIDAHNYVTSYFMAIEIYRYSQWKWAWPWPLERVKVKSKYVSQMSICDFVFHGNSNACLSVTITLYIFAVEVCPTLTLILTFKMDQGQFSKYANQKSPYATSYLTAAVMFAISVTALEIFAVEICLSDTLTFDL